MALAILKSPPKREKEKLVIPTLDQISATYAGLTARKAELHAQKSKVEAEIAEVRKVLASGDTRPKSRLAALLGDMTTENSPEPSLTRLAELQALAEDLRQALVVLEDRIVHAAQEASGLICDLVRDEHRQRARGVCLKLISLREAMLEYLDLVDQLNARDIAWEQLGPSHLMALGDPRDWQSTGARYLYSACERGFIDANELPWKEATR